MITHELVLPDLGIGTAQLGNLYRRITEEESAAIIEAAWESGIRYFDTAPHYGLGLSETRLGDGLRNRPRDEYLVSTKAGRLLVPSPGRTGQMDTDFLVPASLSRQWDLSRDGIRRSLDESLERLGLDRVDILFLHDPDAFEEQAVREALPAMAELRDEGIVGAIGVGMNQSAMLARFAAQADIDLVMLAGRYTLLEQGALADLLPAALEHDVAVVAAGVYNSGLLASTDIASDARYDYGSVPTEIVERTRAIAAVCRDFNVTVPEAAIQFPLRHPAVASVVVGTDSVLQVTEAVERHGSAVPGELWRALVERGVMDPRILDVG